jgi:hypothetical protein
MGPEALIKMLEQRGKIGCRRPAKSVKKVNTYSEAKARPYSNEMNSVLAI